MIIHKVRSENLLVIIFKNQVASHKEHSEII